MEPLLVIPHVVKKRGVCPIVVGGPSKIIYIAGNDDTVELIYSCKYREDFEMQPDKWTYNGALKIKRGISKQDLPVKLISLLYPMLELPTVIGPACEWEESL